MDFLQYFYLLASTWPWFFGQHLLVQTDDVVSNGLQLIWCTITTGIIIHSTCSDQSWVCFFSKHSFQGPQWLYTWNFWPNNISANCHHTNNAELLSLHFKQCKNGGSIAWIRCLAHAIKKQLGMRLQKLYSYPLNCLYFQTQWPRMLI